MFFRVWVLKWVVGQFYVNMYGMLYQIYDAEVYCEISCTDYEGKV